MLTHCSRALISHGVVPPLRRSRDRLARPLPARRLDDLESLERAVLDDLDRNGCGRRTVVAKRERRATDALELQLVEGIPERGACDLVAVLEQVLDRLSDELDGLVGPGLEDLRLTVPGGASCAVMNASVSSSSAS